MNAAASSTIARGLQALLLAALAAAALAFLPLHDGRWWQGPASAAQGWLAGLLLAAYVGASVTTLWRARRRERALARAEATQAGIPDADEWLVVHASQTGQAVEYAEHTAASLRDAGQRVRVRAIATVDATTLAAAHRALFIASTTGEGDAPDPAAGFIRSTMQSGVALPGLRYAVLALGDRSYSNYCAFGQALEQWLRATGAEALFDLIEVDNGDPAALRHWQHLLGTAAGAPELADWAPATFTRWTLAGRRELNPGSVGGAVYEVLLSPPSGAAQTWRAGDIAEIGPRQAPDAVDGLLAAADLDPAARVQQGGKPVGLRELLSRSQLPQVEAIRGLDAQTIADRLQRLPAREYSIASVPEEGRLRLLLREMLRPDGSPGIGSGWLCRHAALDTAIDLRIRANPGFHGPATDVPVLLIGNGTGIAGLRAHLAERIAGGGRRSWLLFGERHGDRDVHQRDDILQWLARDELARLDLAFSRDPAGAGLPAAALEAERAAVHRGYVQDALRTQASRLRQWLDEGATILVCGSLQGMAPGVDAVLRDILGDAQVDELRASGRYRRDVY